MTINHALALRQQFTGGKPARSRNNVVFYPLSLGTGNPLTDPGDLAYLDMAPLKILPTFALVSTFGITHLCRTLPGIGYDLPSACTGIKK